MAIIKYKCDCIDEISHILRWNQKRLWGRRLCFRQAKRKESFAGWRRTLTGLVCLLLARTNPVPSSEKTLKPTAKKPGSNISTAKENFKFKAAAEKKRNESS